MDSASFAVGAFIRCEYHSRPASQAGAPMRLKINPHSSVGSRNPNGNTRRFQRRDTDFNLRDSALAEAHGTGAVKTINVGSVLEDSVVGGFEEIDPSQVSSLSQEYTVSYLKRTGQRFLEPTVIPHGSGSMKLAILVFEVTDCSAGCYSHQSPKAAPMNTDRMKRVQAVGQASQTKAALCLCYMHAQQLIDYYSTHDTTGEAGNEPRPLMVKQNSVITREAAPRRPSRHCTLEEFDDHCEAVKRYLVAKESAVRGLCYRSGLIPHEFGGHPVSLVAAKLLRDTRRCVDPQASCRIYNMFQQRGIPPPLFAALRATPGVSLCSLPLHFLDGGLVALGAGRNNKEAKARCAMHAEEILRIMQVVKAEGCGGSSSIGLSSESVKKTMDPHVVKVFELYMMLTGSNVVTSFAKEQRPNGTLVYTCNYCVGELVCRGQGLNRFEAERAAAVVAFEELENCDPLWSDISDLLKRCPTIDPPTLQTLCLSDDALHEARSVIHRCEAQLKASGLFALDVGGTAVPSTDRVDVHTRRLLEVMKDKQRAPEVAMKLEERLRALRCNPHYLRHFHGRRSSLAMAKLEDQIVEAVGNHQVTVICGTTGCGKTTQVPQFLLDHEIRQGRGDICSIVISQPRRISAMSIADRIAAERLQTVIAPSAGAPRGEVGYSVRLDSRPGTHINLCTTGVLLQMFVGQPNLDHITHLIIDEIHERDINCDVALALTKDMLTRNKSIKVILMSATLDAEKFANYFGCRRSLDGKAAAAEDVADSTAMRHVPIVRVDGQTYPVEELYLEDIACIARDKKFHSSMVEELWATSNAHRRNSRLSLLQPQPQKLDYRLIAFLVSHAIAQFGAEKVSTKSVLVFLPGWKELLAAKNEIELLRNDLFIVLLHSTIDSAKQRECFDPPPAGMIKVVLATNIAESGITIDDAAVVIDTGLIKLTSDQVVGSFGQALGSNQHSAMQLSLVYASKANCTQRRGRAGRTQGGVCYRLFSRNTWDLLPSFLLPEIQRVSLDQVVLRLLAIGYPDPQLILSNFLDPPNPAAVDKALATLKSLDATDAAGALTTLGLYLSKLPCSPRIGKVIVLGALLNCMDTVLTLASTNDVQPFITRRELSSEVRRKRFLFAHQSQSDHIANVNVYNSFVAQKGSRSYSNAHLINSPNMHLISKYKRQFRDILEGAGLIPKSQSRQHTSDSLFVDRSAYSEEWSNIELVKACMVGGLFPNIAMLHTGESEPGNESKKRKSSKKILMRLRNGMVLSPSKESACRKPDRKKKPSDLLNDEDDSWNTPGSSTFMYEGIFRIADANQTFLTNVSSINLWAILIFGAPSADITFHKQLALGLVGDWLPFKTTGATVEIILEVKRMLHRAMWVKYEAPNHPIGNEVLHELRMLCSRLLSAPVTLALSSTERKATPPVTQRGKIVAPWTSVTELESEEQLTMRLLGDDDGDDED